MISGNTSRLVSTGARLDTVECNKQTKFYEIIIMFTISMHAQTIQVTNPTKISSASVYMIYRSALSPTPTPFPVLETVIYMHFLPSKATASVSQIILKLSKTHECEN